jgi:hypothetical protein
MKIFEMFQSQNTVNIIDFFVSINIISPRIIRVKRNALSFNATISTIYKYRQNKFISWGWMYLYKYLYIFPRVILAFFFT